MTHLQKTTEIHPRTSSELLVDLSEQDQETISAGYLSYVFLQHEKISTTGFSDLEIENLGSGNEVPLSKGRSSQRTTYDAERTTFAFGGMIPTSSVASFIASFIKMF
jgi:hypothetical protein